MKKKLLQTKELVKELMINAFKDALPELDTLSSFPLLIFDKEQKFIWLWLLPDDKALTFSRDGNFRYFNHQPESIMRCYQTSFSAEQEYCYNTYNIDHYVYKRKVYNAQQDDYAIVQSSGISVEYQFTNTFSLKGPSYFEALEADYSAQLDKQQKLLDTAQKASPKNLIGFEVPVYTSGFILVSDYEYYRDLVSNISEITDFVDLKDGVDYSQKDFSYYRHIIRMLQERTKKQNEKHLTASLDRSLNCYYNFPCFKDMTDLLQRREELFDGSISDKDVQDFVYNHNKQLLHSDNRPILTKAIFSGHNNQGAPLLKLL